MVRPGCPGFIVSGPENLQDRDFITSLGNLFATMLSLVVFVEKVSSYIQSEPLFNVTHIAS